jgi:hypothetical protein
MPPLLMPPLLMDVADAASAVAQLREQVHIHRPRVARAFGLRHDILGHNAVLVHDVDEHVPLPAIVERMPQQPGHDAVIQWQVRRLDDCFEQVIRALDLVPEERVILAELELLEIHRLHRTNPEQVQPGKHPAPARPFLIRDLPVIQPVRDRMIELGCPLMTEGNIFDLVPRDGILGHSIVGIVNKRAAELGNQVTGHIRSGHNVLCEMESGYS